MSRKLTNEIVDNRLIEKHYKIKRLSNYVTAVTKMDWLCLSCNNTWSAVPNSIMSLGSGCPHCNGGVKLSNEIIDNRLGDRDITRIGEYIGANSTIEWECNVCHNIWNASPNNVVNSNTGCPVCGLCIAGKHKTLFSKQKNLDILARKNLSLKTEYTKSTDVHEFVCNKCNYTWTALLNSVIQNPHNGCKSCSGLLPLTNEVVDHKLTLRSDKITRLENIINATTKISWQCEFEHQWKAVPDSIINAGSGCPICNRGGVAFNETLFKRDVNLSQRPAIFYFLRFTSMVNSNTSFLKIGISTNTIKKRYRGLDKKYKIDILYTESKSLISCWRKETQLLYLGKEFKHHDIPKSFGGRTECFIDTPEVEQQILELINNSI